MCYLTAEHSIYDFLPGTECMQPQSYLLECVSRYTPAVYHFNVDLALIFDLMAVRKGLFVHMCHDIT